MQYRTVHHDPGPMLRELKMGAGTIAGGGEGASSVQGSACQFVNLRIDSSLEEQAAHEQ
jgi:hypothetical protein